MGPVDVGHGDPPGEVSQGSHPSGPGKVLAEGGPASEPGHREWPLHLSAQVCSEQHRDRRGQQARPQAVTPPPDCGHTPCCDVIKSDRLPLS